MLFTITLLFDEVTRTYANMPQNICKCCILTLCRDDEKRLIFSALWEVVGASIHNFYASLPCRSIVIRIFRFFRTFIELHAHWNLRWRHVRPAYFLLWVTKNPTLYINVRLFTFWNFQTYQKYALFWCKMCKS